MQTYTQRLFAAVATASVCATLAACGGEPSQPARHSTRAAASPDTKPSPSYGPPLPTEAAGLTGTAARCGPPQNAAAHEFNLTGPGRSRMPAVILGHGRTTAIFLHQTNGDGLCGWWQFANYLTGRAPVRALLLDLCGFGHSDCPSQAFTDDQVAQVRRAMAWARAHNAPRVVIVGSSMGGSVALAAAVAGSADAVVDLSGPVDWPSVESAPLLPQLTMPTLIAISPVDDGSAFQTLHDNFPRIPDSRKTFIRVQAGHGWDMLTDLVAGTLVWDPLAQNVIDWITGRY